MPKDWKMGKLEDVADLIAGFAFKAQCFGKSYDDKVVKITDIDENGISIDGLSGVDISGIEKDRILKYKVFTGDYVLAMTGSIGKFGRVLEGEAYINQRVLVVRNKSSIMKNLLYYALKQKRFTQHLITHIDSHSVQANISANSIGEYELIVPSKEMQNRYESKVDVFVKKIITLNSESRALAELRDALLPKLMSGELDVDDVEV
jgi:type I restriction enzyme S subunit